MASHDPPPIRNQADFNRAMTELEQLLDEPHELNAEDRYFAYLLGQIADYHDSLPPERREANQDRLVELNQHLKSYGLHWPDPHHGERHWSPSVHQNLHAGHRNRA
jgi:antitoxin component HigA of HigAB toxin-antitoxin module